MKKFFSCLFSVILLSSFLLSGDVDIEKEKAAIKKVSFKFLLVDVVGNAGFAKIEFYKGEKLAYTDFLSLYKFKNGWKLVAKIYYQH